MAEPVEARVGERKNKKKTPRWLSIDQTFANEVHEARTKKPRSGDINQHRDSSR